MEIRFESSSVPSFDYSWFGLPFLQTKTDFEASFPQSTRLLKQSNPFCLLAEIGIKAIVLVIDHYTSLIELQIIDI